MNKETILVLARYNKAVNEKMLDIIKTLSPAEWEKNLGGYLSSVQSLCTHTYIGDYNWLKRFGNLRNFTVLGESFFSRDAISFKEALFPDMKEYLSKRPELDEKLISFANEVNDGDMKNTFKYTDSRGGVNEKNFGICAIQCFTHGIHHRAMVSIYLELLGRPNDFSTMQNLDLL